MSAAFDDWDLGAELDIRAEKWSHEEGDRIWGLVVNRDVYYSSEYGPSPTEIRCAINVVLAWDEESLRAQFGNLADLVRDATLAGSDDEVVERVGRYIDAGADQVNIALRAPFQPEALERLMLVLRGASLVAAS